MGLLSKATELLKEEIRKIEATKKLSTTTVNPTVAKSNQAVKPTAPANTIRPMATPNLNRGTYPTAKPAIKMPAQTEVKPATAPRPTAPRPVASRPVASHPVASRPTVTTNTTVATSKPVNPQPTVDSHTTKMAAARIRSNAIALNPNRHTTGFIPVTNKPVHPKSMRKTNTNAYMMANAAGYGHFQGSAPRPTMNQTMPTNQPMMSMNQNAGRPTPTPNQQPARPTTSQQYSSSRPMTTGRSATAATMPSRANTMTRPSATTSNRSATTMSRPSTMMTRPQTAGNQKTAVRPARKARRIIPARKGNRVVAIKIDTPKILKLVSALALTFSLQIGMLNVITNMESTIGPVNYNLDNFYNPKIELSNQGHQKTQKVSKLKKQTTKTVVKAEKQNQNVAAKKEEVKPTVIVANQKATQNTVIEKSIQEFTQGLQSQFTQRDREVFAKMIYGEAGRGIDPFEVGHVALNRLASGRFGKTLTEVITAKRQFDGFSEKHPIDKDCLAIANELIAEFELNDCKPFCNYYYFYTHPEKHLGQKYNRNIFMSGVEWRPYARENYTETYCQRATEHAAHYHAQRNNQKAATHVATLTR